MKESPCGRLIFTDEEIAEVIHNMVRGLDSALEHVASPPEWKELSAEAQARYVESVRLIKRGLTPAQIHEHWRVLLESRGWKAGPKDYGAKRHPMLQPYDELSALEKLKGKLAITTVLTIAGYAPPVTAPQAAP